MVSFNIVQSLISCHGLDGINRASQDIVEDGEVLVTSKCKGIPGLPLQLLGDKELLDPGPGELPAPDLVVPPVGVEAVLGAVASLPAPGAPVGPQGVPGAAVADLTVRHEPDQRVPLTGEIEVVAILSMDVTIITPPTSDDWPPGDGIDHLEDTGSHRHPHDVDGSCPDVTISWRQEELGFLSSQLSTTTYTLSPWGENLTAGLGVVFTTRVPLDSSILQQLQSVLVERLQSLIRDESLLLLG